MENFSGVSTYGLGSGLSVAGGDSRRAPNRMCKMMFL